MSFFYVLALITLLGYPLIASQISKHAFTRKIKITARWLVVFFALHNILFFIGFSIKGNYPDYIVFSLEYFTFCYIVFMLAGITGGFLKFVRVVGLIIIYIGALIGVCGIFLFIFIAQDYEPDKYVRFSSEGTLYETRQYAFGGATLSNTRYTFETYRQYSFLPFEQKIDVTDFFDDKTNIDLQNITIGIDAAGGRLYLVFSSKGVRPIRKTLH